jgi:hypothetical protein
MNRVTVFGLSLALLAILSACSEPAAPERMTSGKLGLPAKVSRRFLHLTPLSRQG